MPGIKPDPGQVRPLSILSFLSITFEGNTCKITVIEVDQPDLDLWINYRNGRLI